VCAIQLPGRESRLFDPALEDVDTMIAALLEHLPSYFDRPYAFYGHSMGALVAFELTRSIEKLAGIRGPERLFLAAHRAAHLPLQRLPMSTLSDADFIEKIRGYGGFVDEILNNAEIMELILPTIRADFRLCDHYKLKDETLIQCPIHVFAGSQDTQTLLESTYSWSLRSKAPVDVQAFAGGHFFLQSHMHEVHDAIIKKLTSC
jgi:surfactin synthase thioesterase subunit